LVNKSKRKKKKERVLDDMLYGTVCHLLQKTHEQLPREVIFQGHLMPRFSLKQDKKTPPS
jgi:hypothetical protein